VTNLGRGINELNVNLFGHPGLCGGKDGFSENNRSLSGSHDSTLDQNEIFINFSIVREATEWSDVLLNGISLAVSIVSGTTS